MSPYLCIPPNPSIKLIKTSKKTIDHQFIKNGRTLPYLSISTLFYLAHAQKNTQKRPTNTTLWHNPPTLGRKSKIASLLYYIFFFAHATPLARTHGHLRMPSTPGVRDLSHRYRIFPARRAMPTKCTKLQHSVYGSGCRSLDTHPTGDARAWTYAC